MKSEMDMLYTLKHCPETFVVQDLAGITMQNQVQKVTEEILGDLQQSLQSRLERFTGTLLAAESKIKSLQSQVEEKQAVIDSQRASIDRLQSRLEGLEKRFASSETHVKELEAHRNDLQKNLQ